MLVTSSRTTMMGPLASPVATSPGSHHLSHHHTSHSDDDDHHPADLSPRSSSSSLVSSNESLLNTPISVPSPTHQRTQLRTSVDNGGDDDVDSGHDDHVSGSSPASSPAMKGGSHSQHSGSTASDEDINVLQNLRNAFERSQYSSYFHHHEASSSPQNNKSENDQMEQHINKAFTILGSPVVSHHHHHLLNSPTNLSKSGDETTAMMSDDEGHAYAMSLIGSVSPKNHPRQQASVQTAAIFQCTLCAIVCNSRHDFNEHIVTHSTQHRACPNCSFIATNADELRDHLQDLHGGDDLGILSDDEEVKTPKTNAQGKLKTFKCKQCDYVAVTKKEFWDHNKSTHIRQEKMLHCPKCDFVTEYKHHLEYHLRRHTGSKPYKCNMCDYSCVNKSMLNSHLKSHSNVYQYRCSDCSYATKYCHSLKLHLRKYNHQPAMVLNPDGTPNPLPIIDVYGTRRGPKIKRPDPLAEGLASTNPPHVPGTPQKPSAPKKKGLTGPKKGKAQPKPHLLHQQMIIDARDLSPKPARSPQYISSMPNQSGTPPLQKIKEELSGGDSDSEMRMPINAHHHHHLNSSSNGKTQLPQAPISPSSIALILQRSNSNGSGERDHAQQRKEAAYPRPSGSPNPLELYNAAINQYLLNPVFHMPNASLNDLLAAQMANEQKTKLLAQLLQSGMVPNTQQQQNLANDLRSVVTSASNGGFGSGNGVLDLSGTGNITVAVEDVKKRNRKGKARRYEARPEHSDDEDDMMMSMRHGRVQMQEDDGALDFSNNNNNNSYKDKNKKRKLDGQGQSPTDLSHPSPPLFQNMMCKYCEISFPGRELYSIHMNYHSGDENPFLCRSCGKKTRDKIEFFKHLATDPH